MRWGIGGLLIALLISAVTTPASAQLERAALGAGVGVVGGAVITMGTIVARARFQHEYIDSVDDLIHWQSIPMIAAPASGVLFGLAGDEALIGSMVGSTSGLLVGAVAGSALGWFLSTEQEAPWAGAVMGAGLGLTLGGLAGGIIGWSGDEDPGLTFPSSLRLSVSIPTP